MIAEQILAHLVGDYILQSHWMAVEKTKRWWPAVVHGATYTLPFLLITQSVPALIIIFATHVVIDRYRLARHVSWLKNLVGPKTHRASFSRLIQENGYPSGTPVGLSTALMIVTDNTLHILINAAAIAVFG